jgi:hypothetical protein
MESRALYHTILFNHTIPEKIMEVLWDAFTGSAHIKNGEK